MAQAKAKLDELEAQKLDKDGGSIAANTARELADRLVMEARAALKTIPTDSPYRNLDRDRLLAEAVRLGVQIGPLVSEDDLRFVLEHVRYRLATAGTPKAAPPAPPVAMQPPRLFKMKGLKESPSNTWKVVCPGDRPRTVSVGNGQMATLHNGKIVALRNYGEVVLRGMVNAGIKLVPIEDPDPEE